MAATDCTLLALAGTGHASQRSFGFASCNRAVGASEGMNVLQRRKRASTLGENEGAEAAVEYEYGVTNVEYTEFTRLGIEDKAVEGGTESAFPANTNILYVGASTQVFKFSHTRLCVGAWTVRKLTPHNLRNPPIQQVSSACIKMTWPYML